MLDWCFKTTGNNAMPSGLTFLLIMIAFIIVYTLVRVVQYVRLSEKQWQQVDKSKLKEWQDDDEW
jgi:hypothetical protein